MAIKLRTTSLSEFARRSVTYAVLIIVLAIVFFSVEFVIEKFFYNNDEVVDIVSATIGTLLFSRFRTSFETWTDRVFFRGQYDYTEATKELNTVLYATIDLQELLRLIANLLAKTIKPEMVRFILADSKEPIVFTNPNIARSHEKFDPRDSSRIATTLPFPSKEGVVATMLVGKKLSGGELTAKDGQLLQTISHQAGIAIENAVLYEALREHSEDLESRVAQKTERIREMYDAQSKFLTDIAHEFQTPISILKGNLALLAKESASARPHAKANEKASEKSKRTTALYVATTTLDRLSRLVINLLDIAKLNFSKDKLAKQLVDVRKLLEETYEDCTILAQDKNVRISFVSEPVFVAGDTDKLKEVLLNLVSNALKHTPAGGSISLAGRHDGENVEIAVVDTGDGIAPENLPQIFERFYTIDPQGAIESGNGIGLHLCRQIIEAHSGTIVAESEPGNGSRFVIHLPAASRFALATHVVTVATAPADPNKSRDIINECPQPQ